MTRSALPSPSVAVIDEPACIGCTLCIEVCPVDAILGAAQRMHTVIADECTGCRWCVPVCPVDCIAMLERAGPLAAAERRVRAAQYRRRHAARTARLAGERADAAAAASEGAAPEEIREAVERAMQRARRQLKEQKA